MATSDIPSTLTIRQMADFAHRCNMSLSQYIAQRDHRSVWLEQLDLATVPDAIAFANRVGVDLVEVMRIISRGTDEEFADLLARKNA